MDLCFLCFLLAIPMVWTAELPDIYWNSSNPMFRIDTTDHVMTAQIRDSVSIHCPKFDQKSPTANVEYSIIFMVSKYGYDNCRLDRAKAIGRCDQPEQARIFTVVFREFTPMPGGLEVRPGESYYFISTSDGTEQGMQNERGGLCQFKNMKLRFDVKENPNYASIPSPSYPSLGPRWNHKTHIGKPLPSPSRSNILDATNSDDVSNFLRGIDNSQSRFAEGNGIWDSADAFVLQTFGEVQGPHPGKYVVDEQPLADGERRISDRGTPEQRVLYMIEELPDPNAYALSGSSQRFASSSSLFLSLLLWCVLRLVLV